MRSFLGALVLAFVAADVSAQTTWYVRTDGGTYGTDSTHCNGQTDAAFTGSNGPGCAVKHPFEILGVKENNPITQRIAGGDTVIIKNGSYKMGYAAGTYETGWCNPLWTYECRMNDIPSGPDDTHKTKIYGEGYASCSTKPELWGTGGTSGIFYLNGSSNVDIRCLDITDHAQCGGNYSSFACPSAGPSATWARMGMIAYNGSNNELTDVDIHGLAFEGVQAGKQTSFTATRLNIIGNAFGGFDQDTFNSDDAWAGTNVFDKLRILWSGCSENYPVDGGYRGCTDQNNTGYGDAWGSPGNFSGGDFTFTDGEISFNTSDGLDLLYNTDATALVIVDRMKFEGNVGNIIKTGSYSAGSGPNVIIRNSAIISNCGSFWDAVASKGPAFSACRAGGNNIVLMMGGGSSSGHVDIVNNSIVGESDILIEAFGCDGAETLNIFNNAMKGTTQWPGGDTTSWFYPYFGCDSTLISTSTAKNNIIYAVKEGSPCTGQTSCSTADPKFTTANFTTNAFDLRLQSSSTAINAGLATGTTVGQTTVPTVDVRNVARPAGVVDVGAYEYTTTTPTMATCSLAGGTVGVAYSQTITVTGGTTPYTACDETVGALPAGSPAFTSTPSGGGCVIAGTPTGAGTTNFTERVTDSAAQTDSKACSLVVAAGAPDITTTTLPDGIVGFAYSAQINVTGGTLPYTACDESVGSLPAGSPAFASTANSGGCLITGTPTGAGTTNFTERVTDSSSQTDTQALSLTVAASVGVIVYSVQPGSDYVLVVFGFAGLPYDADCHVQVYNAAQQIVGSGLSSEGFAKRAVVVAGLTASTSYSALLSCDVPSGEVTQAFTTLATPSGGNRTVPISLKPAAILSTAARVTVDYGTTTAVADGTAQGTSCASGCTVNLTLPAGLRYWCARWQTAADAFLTPACASTAMVQPLQVQ